MKTTEQIQVELDALQAELKAINSRSAEIDALRDTINTEQLELAIRRQKIDGYQIWRGRNSGLIDVLNLELLESQSPIYDATDARVRRIISIDKKWIELKYDGQSLDTSIKYNRATGWRMRARDASCAIDAVKAFEIWNVYHER